MLVGRLRGTVDVRALFVTGLSPGEEMGKSNNSAVHKVDAQVQAQKRLVVLVGPGNVNVELG